MIYYQNAHGLRTKLKSLSANLYLMAVIPNIIALTETYLSEEIMSEELQLTNYHIYRQDRNSLTSSQCSGGGVLLAISKHLHTTPISITCKSLEQLFVAISLRSLKVIIGVTYIPPNSPASTYELHAASVEEVSLNYPDHKLFLIGDYNLPNAVWGNDNELSAISHAYLSPNLRDGISYLRTTFSSLQLKQHYPVHQSKGYTLDLLFSDVPGLSTYSYQDQLIKTDSHHGHLFVDFCYIKHSELQYSANNLDFSSVNYSIINNDLSLIKWDCVLKDLNLDDKVSMFYEKVHNVLYKHVPMKRTFSSIFPIWYNKELKDLIFQKKIAHIIWKNSNLNSDHIEFKRLRAHCIRKSRVDYDLYICNTENYLKTNVKAFWSFIKNKKSNCDLPATMHHGRSSSSEGHTICNFFASHFSSVYSTDDLLEEQLLSGYSVIENLNITEEKLRQYVYSLKPNNKPGPDNVPAFFFKNCFSNLSIPLLLIFNESLSLGYFPSMWKASFIFPIFKSGDKHSVNNYRPITIVSAIPKVLDHFVADSLMDAFSDSILSQQHGFVKGKSTLTNLLIFTNFIHEAFANHNQVDAIYTDFTKAFDVLNHKRLLWKLWNMGIRSSAFNWLKSYLSNRSQIVRIKGFVSDPFSAPSGVPQGSHLGPILFTLFINDISNYISHSQFLLYADDLKIYSKINSPLDSSNLQRDIDSISLWCSINGMKINLSKCVSVSFSRSGSNNNFKYDYRIVGSSISPSPCCRDLGVYLDESLSYESHIDHITKKASRTLGFICRSTRDFKNPQSLITLYTSLVKPYLIYLAPIWKPYTLNSMNLLEGIQRKFLRCLSRLMDNPMSFIDHNYSRVSSLFNIPTICSQLDYEDYMLMHKIENHKISCVQTISLFMPRDINYPLRCIRPLLEKLYTPNSLFYSTIPRLTRMWNTLSLDLRSITQIGSFKNQIRSLSLKCYT